MWLYVLVAVFTGTLVQAQHLIGDYICRQEEKYNVTIEKQITKNVTLREYVWCVNVPPRCSKYRTVQRDEIKLEEEVRVRLVDKCCEGYEEDETRTYCIPKCNECVHGRCVAPDKCNCSVGYMGTACNQTCSSDRWGEGCCEMCNCPNDTACDIYTGYCLCGSDRTGPECNFLCNKYPTHPNCTIQCICNSTEECNNESKECITKIIQKTKELPAIIGTNNFTVITQELCKPEINSSSTQENAASRTRRTEVEITTKLERTDIIERRYDQRNRITTTPIVDIGNKSKKNFDDTGKTHPFSDNITNYKSKLIKHDTKYSNDTNSGFLLNSISIAFTLSTALILIAVISILISCYKKKRRSQIKNTTENNSSRDANKNPEIKLSTFHAPLPDPPLFQNPVFTLIADNRCPCSSYNNKVYFNNCPENKDLQYDYLPPTGSYRAVSIPEPESEPLYDEIPVWRKPKPVTESSLLPVCTHCIHSCRNGTPNEHYEKT